MFLKNKNIIFKIRRSKVTDYAALTNKMQIWRLFCRCTSFNLCLFYISFSALCRNIYENVFGELQISLPDCTYVESGKGMCSTHDHTETKAQDRPNAWFICTPPYRTAERSALMKITSSRVCLVDQAHINWNSITTFE